MVVIYILHVIVAINRQGSYASKKKIKSAKNVSWNGFMKDVEAKLENDKKVILYIKYYKTKEMKQLEQQKQ